jgi:hypothetical protein
VQGGHVNLVCQEGASGWGKHIWVICSEAKGEVSIWSDKGDVAAHGNFGHGLGYARVVCACFIRAPVDELEIVAILGKGMMSVS